MRVTETPQTETPKKKSDLKVRAMSAVVMLAVAGTALWLGGWVWVIFASIVALVGLGESIRLIWLATSARHKRILAGIAATFYFGFSGYLLALLPHKYLHDSDGTLGIVSVLAVVGTVVATDIGAYFSGRAIGGPKIAPRISPSKTWAGLAGGMLAACIWSVVALQMFFATPVIASSLSGFPLVKACLGVALCGAALAVVAQSGDFFESWLKRKAGVKDSSNLIPGHGGVFDRVDGLLPVVLVSAYLPSWIWPF